MKKSHQRLLACGLCLLLTAAFLSGCGAPKSETPANGDMEMYTTAESPAVEPPMPAQETPALDVGGGTQTAGVPNQSQKIIYSALLQLETTAFDDAVLAIDKLVADYGGFVENANVDGNAVQQPDGTTRVENRTARYALRVPSNKFETALKQAGTIGNVTTSTRDAQNVTSQFIDNEARRDSLKVQEERLLSMMEKSTDVETLIALESRLADVRYEFESIERQLRNWQTQVDFSTIALSVREVAIYTPTVSAQRTYGEKLSTAFSDGMTRFGRGAQNFSIGLAGAVPTLLLLGVIALAAGLTTRKLLRKRKATQAAATPPPKKEDTP